MTYRWAGTGGELWHARVETFVDDDSGRLVGPAADAASLLLTGGGGRGAGADQGTWMATPVIGLAFAVAADSPGQAAQTAVDVASQALGAEGRRLYGVSVFRASEAPADVPGDYPSLMD
jgi:hypothetical protein